jgi:predicted ATPase/class 3 adenylate cyclase
LSNSRGATVSFLFTDIESSTARWERVPEAMAAALERHDVIVRHEIEAHGGTVFNVTGDGFCAVFALAEDAAAASVALQIALQQADDHKAQLINVRAALHTGEALQRAGNYFGPALNRSARLLAAGHGGQILLTGAVRALIAGHLPPGVQIRDHGEHRLRDLARPERIYSLIVPGLPSSFPPLRTIDYRPTNLPSQVTSFVGRGRDLAAVRDLLLEPSVRLVTLTGPGGVGKTRLALQVATGLLDQFRDGVFFVPLSSLARSTEVASTIVQHLGIATPPEHALSDLLREYLQDKNILVLLDTFEHVREAAPLVGTLLEGCPDLRILVTSRARLRIYGERVYDVQPLAAPELSQLHSLENLARNDAVELFVARARAARPDFVLTNENAPTVAQICRQMDGLPLAIELAAARSRLLSPGALLAVLSGKLTVLSGGARDRATRQQTLRATIDWSYDLLDEPQKLLFRRLAVFAGGCTIDAAVAVAGATLDDLEALTDNSLLRAVDQAGDPRVTMLDTIREYGLEKLTASPDNEDLRRRHAAYFCELAMEVGPQLGTQEQADRLDRLEIEHDNLRAALAWSVERDPEQGLQLATSIEPFWEIRGHFAEGQRWLQLLLHAAPAATLSRARALVAMGHLMYFAEFDPVAARPAFEEGLPIFRELGSAAEVGQTLSRLARIAIIEGDDERARAYLAESLPLARSVGDRSGLGLALNYAAELAYWENDYLSARTLAEECLAVRREVGDARYIASALVYFGTTCLLLRDYDRAREALEEGLTISREIGSKALICINLFHLGTYALEVANVPRAREYAVEAATIALEAGSYQAAVALRLCGLVAIRETELERAVRLLSAAERAIRPSARRALPPNWFIQGEAALTAARDALPDAIYQRAWQEGQRISTSNALAGALTVEIAQASDEHNGHVA